MNRTVLFLAAALLGAANVSASIIYGVTPTVLSNGYAISSGRIEVRETISTLTESDILDFQVQVTGPSPFTFTRANSVPTVDGRVLANPSALSVLAPPANWPKNLLAFETRGARTPEHELVWEMSSAGNGEGIAHILYRVDVGIARGETFPPGRGVLFVGTPVPEPSSLALLTLVIAGAVAGRSRQSLFNGLR